jgi:hypothetical protein
MNKNYKENNLYDYDLELEYLFSLQSNYCIYFQVNSNGNLIAIWKIKFKIIKSN